MSKFTVYLFMRDLFIIIGKTAQKAPSYLLLVLLYLIVNVL